MFVVSVTGLFGGLPLLVVQSARFLGRDVSQVAVGIIGFYPSAAIFEVLRILGVMACVFAGLGWPWALLSKRTTSKTRQRVLFPAAPCAVYLLFLCGILLKYPAFFAPYLAEPPLRALHLLAFWTKPAFFWRAAFLIYLVPWLFLLVEGIRHGLKKSAQLSSHTQKLPDMLRILMLFALLAVGLVSFSWFPKAAESSRVLSTSSQPNILFIAIDSLRQDRLGRQDVVPAIRKFMEDPNSVHFLDHHVGVPRTFPSWVELITGQYAPRTGIRHMFPGFAPRTRRFSGFVSKLHDAGYQTKIWSDFAGDIFPRFESGFEALETPNLTLKTMIRLSMDQAFPAFLPILMAPPINWLFPALKQSPAFADSSQLTSALLKELKQESRPWLKAIFYSTAHFPYAAPHPYYAMFSNSQYEGPFLFEKNPELGVGPGGISDVDRDQVRSLYDGAVRAIDDDLEKLFSTLKERGLWDSTLIVLTADHGEDLYEHGRQQGHGEHLRGTNVLQVPLIFKFPKNIQPGRHTVQATSRSIDVGPTVLSICGLDPTGSDGESLLPFVRGDSGQDGDRPAYSETGLWFSRTGDAFFQQQRLDYPGIARLLSFDQGYSGEIVLDPRFEKIVMTAKHRSLVLGDYKIIYIPTPDGVKYELYNRRSDPDNLVDLSKTDPVRLSMMRSQILSMIGELESGVSIVDDFVVPKS